VREIKILYFARVKEKLNYSIEPLQLSDEIRSIRDLKHLLAQRGEAWADIFAADKQLRAAVNHQLVNDDYLIQDQDEVGFFPPVSGG
jgi:molybdopterin synthase sulfur carrier subunit